MSKVPFILGDNFVTLFLDGENHTFDKSHMNYDAVVQALKEGNVEKIRQNLSAKDAIEYMGEGDIKIEGNTLYYRGEPLHNTLTDRIIRMLQEGFDVEPFKKFLVNLKENPSRTAVQELYDFLETGEMPITEDGCFLAYKKVRGNYTDIFSGKFDNSIGAVAEMERNQVDDVRDRTCSKGLHFCSLGYLPCYGGFGGNRVVIVKINPADVVSIPSDYNYTKGRTCRYEVVGEHQGNYHSEEWFDRAVYTSRGEPVEGSNLREVVDEGAGGVPFPDNSAIYWEDGIIYYLHDDEVAIPVVRGSTIQSSLAEDATVDLVYSLSSQCLRDAITGDCLRDRLDIMSWLDENWDLFEEGTLFDHEDLLDISEFASRMDDSYAIGFER